MPVIGGEYSRRPLLDSLSMNHPFVDGNKRVAFFTTDVFLRMNGYRLKVDAHKSRWFPDRVAGKHSLQFQSAAAVNSRTRGQVTGLCTMITGCYRKLLNFCRPQD
jgi:hypothetical protein